MMKKTGRPADIHTVWSRPTKRCHIRTDGFTVTVKRDNGELLSMQEKRNIRVGTYPMLHQVFTLLNGAPPEDPDPELFRTSFHTKEPGTTDKLHHSPSPEAVKNILDLCATGLDNEQVADTPGVFVCPATVGRLRYRSVQVPLHHDVIDAWLTEHPGADLRSTRARLKEEARERRSLCYKNLGPSFQRRAVDQLDLETGEVIASFPSIVEAQRSVGIGNISACCSGNMKHAGGFGWRYADGLPRISKPRGFAEKVSAALTGIKRTPEVKEKMRQAAVRRSERKMPEGYVSNAAAKRVEQVDAATGEVVATFRTMTEAYKATKCTRICLKAAGKKKQSGPWIWRLPQ